MEVTDELFIVFSVLRGKDFYIQQTDLTFISSPAKTREYKFDKHLSTYATAKIIRYTIGMFSGNIPFRASVNTAYCTK